LNYSLLKGKGNMVKQLKKYWLVGILLVLVLALGAAAGTKLSVQSARAASLSMASTPTSWTCTPNLVVSANVRVVARCAAGYSGNTALIWYAYPTTDSAGASRMLSVFETAKATGSTITVYFDAADTSGGAYGCDPTNCRAIWAVTTP
jgi:hypothetical protein